LLIRLNDRGNYSDVQLFTAAFSDQAALGTILYGTYFFHYNRHYFTGEQLYYYKGLAVAKKPYAERMNLLLELFSEHVEQRLYTTTSLIVGLPVMTETYEEALAQLNTLPYKTYGIGAPLPTHAPPHAPPYAPPHAPPPMHLAPAPLPIHAPKPFATKAIFKVKASLAADNYQLYTAEDTLYETAMIPTYKCSVMMNALFRTIKENANLDLLEESDDESEFENTQIDKFVDLEKMILMECVYSKRFKKWQPVKTVVGQVGGKIISIKELQQN
jgi:hypothetical protein